MSSRTPSPCRRGGAPFGNTNALKHGFYSSRFRKSEIADLEATNFTALLDEIAMLRVCIRRMMEWSGSINNFPDALSFMRVMALATASLSRLVRTQEAIGGSGIETAMQEAILGVAQELGIMDELSADQGATANSSATYRQPPTDNRQPLSRPPVVSN